MKIKLIKCFVVEIIFSMFLLMNNYVLANEPVKISLTTKLNDKNVETYVEINNNTGIAGMQFDIIYDDEKFEVVSVEEITENISAKPIIGRQIGKITYITGEVENYQGNGKILKIQFKLKKDYKFESNDITIEEIMVVDENINILETQVISENIEDGGQQEEIESNTLEEITTLEEIATLEENEEVTSVTEKEKEKNNNFTWLIIPVISIALIIILIFVFVRKKLDIK